MIHFKVGKFVCKIYDPSTDKIKIGQKIFCLFELMFTPQSTAMIGTLSPFYGTFTQHKDVRTLKMLVCMDDLTKPLFLGRLRHERLTSNQMVGQ